MNFAERHAALNRSPLELLPKLLATGGLENGIHPLVREDIHQIHTACVRYIDRGDLSQEQRGDERRNEGYAGRVLVQCEVCPSDLVRKLFT